MKITTEQKISELKDVLEHVGHYVQLLKSGKASYVKPLSVELRKLYCSGEGNRLIKRVEEALGVDVKFPVRVKKPYMPPTYTDANVDEYIDEFRFFQEGKEYTRRDIIHMVADKKGAHLDDKEKPFHRFEKATMLPVGNPSKEGVYPLGTKYLIDIGQTTLRVVGEYIEEINTK